MQCIASSGGEEVRVLAVILLLIGGEGLCTIMRTELTDLVQAASPQSSYVLCVDDDVCLHPTTLQDTVSSLEDSAHAFMATGMLLSFQNRLELCFGVSKQFFTF